MPEPLAPALPRMLLYPRRASRRALPVQAAWRHGLERQAGAAKR